MLSKNTGAKNEAVVCCPICNSSSKWPFEHNRDAKVESDISGSHSEPEYRWFLCRTCGNCYPNFVPDLKVLAAQWKRNRDLYNVDSGREKEIWRYRKTISEKGAQRSYELFTPFYKAKPGRFIDIGCGLGETVKLFSDHGWDALGVDADPNMRQFHEVIDIKSHIGQVETLNFENNFDIIHSAHAIYFVTNVRAFIASLRERLADDGLLCIVLADFLRSDDAALPNYAHSFFPTASSMRYLLALEGFEVVLSKRKSGSIFIAARKASGPLPAVYPWLIRVGHESKPLRFALFGRPLNSLKSVAKKMLGIARPAA